MTRLRDDRVQYLGLYYSVGLDIKSKDEGGPELFCKFERYGPLGIRECDGTSGKRLE